MRKRDITYLTDVYLLTCVVQPGHKETILKAARDVGAIAGAISYTARGTGARERLGVWGVAVEAGRDIISILVSSEQRDLVYDTLYRAAGLDVTGKGFIYMTPLEKVSTYSPESLQTRLDKGEGEAS
jgi:nitrogen regulatory protein P-II 1